MDNWPATFHARMRGFEARRPPAPGGLPVSIKIRVLSGCFHREHSPRADKLIDQALASLLPDAALSFEEHESGPELLIYAAAATAAMSLAANVLNLITA